MRISHQTLSPKCMHYWTTNQIASTYLFGHSVLVERDKVCGQGDHFHGSAVLAPPFDRFLAK